MISKKLALFPLNIVAFPGEYLNLHIFEPRYKQLINDCVTEGISFGIPAFFNEKFNKYGTEMALVEIAKKYPDGKMDIRTKGLGVFKIEKIYKKAASKKYLEGQVQMVDSIIDTDLDLSKAIMEHIEKIYTILKVKKDFGDYASFKVAHYIGLSIEQEYDLLKIPDEKSRQNFILNHLKRMLPIVIAANQIKEKAKLNGHFKNIKPLDI